MKKILIFFLLVPIMVVGKTTMKPSSGYNPDSYSYFSTYPNLSQAIIPSQLYASGAPGAPVGQVIINNDVMTITFTGGFSYPQALNTTTPIFTFNTIPQLPNMELGKVYYSSNLPHATNYSVKIENNNLVLYTNGSPNLALGFSFSFSINLNCVNADGSFNSNSTRWYLDNDLDGLGDPANFIVQCYKPAGNYVLDNTDLCPSIFGSAPNCSILSANPQDKNYVRTTIYKVETIDGVTNFLSGQFLTNTQKSINTIYYDGIGRPIQQVANRATPTGKNIITHIEYDAFGRETKKYLPFASTGSSPDYVNTAKIDITNYYNTAVYENTPNPFSEQRLEASPLGRVLEHGAPGLAWAVDAVNDTDHTIKFGYQTNEINEVRKFSVNFVNGDTEVTELACAEYYEPNKLYKTIIKNENWKASDSKINTTEEFKDKEGRVILKRGYAKIEDEDVAHDTYYVYDIFGNLTYVIPPLAADDIAIETITIGTSTKNFPWTKMTRVGQELADAYDKDIMQYENEDILNLDLTDRYGGQGGFTLVPGSDGSIALNINIITDKPMPYRTGIITNLTDVGDFPDRELGRIKGEGYEYYFLLRGNSLQITGDGNVPSLTVTLSGDNPLNYSKNYPFTSIAKITATEKADYEAAISGLDNTEILSVYTQNPYGATGGVSISVDQYDTVTVSVNITTDMPLSLNNGALFPLDIQRRLQDMDLGEAGGYNFKIIDNYLYVSGSSSFTNFTLNSVRSRDITCNIRKEVEEGLCYIYNYDYRNRLIKKRIPDNGWTYLVYDKLDRVVLTQDQKQRSNNEWLFTKYDKFSRPVYSGGVIDVRPRSIIQAERNNAVSPVLNENRITTPFTNNGAIIHYSNTAYPVTGLDIFNVSYYDDYNFDHTSIAIPIDNSYGDSVIQTNKKSLVTGGKTRILGTTSWVTSVIGFDDKCRQIWTKSYNAYFNSYTVNETRLDFVNKVLQTRTNLDNASPVPDVTVKERYVYGSYDHLLKRVKQINSDTEKVIAYYKYDELGQLIQKKVGSPQAYASATTYDNLASLQTVDLTYNVRGWLRGINDITQDYASPSVTDLFAFRINYNAATNSGTAGDATPQYNGNIAETSVKSKRITGWRTYAYQYDGLNRLTDANILPSYGPGGPVYNYREGDITYDKNGNILSLLRYGIRSNSQHGTIDQLSYSYMPYSNKLKSVSDVSDSEGFDNRNTGTADDYTYDATGNMASDANKDIIAIEYNHLNLPKMITFSNSSTISYKYDAVGTKVEKKVYNSINITTTITEYNSIFIYQKINTATKTLQYMPHEEGYVDCTNGFSFVFQYKDHLGNIRLSYSDANGDGAIADSEIIENSNYYAFGLKQKVVGEVITSTNVGQDFKYNGKEFQDELGLNWHSYGARNYDATIAKWFNIDPLAEVSRSWSAYNYCYNNPVRFIDPDGMMPDDPISVRQMLIYEANPPRGMERFNSPRYRNAQVVIGASKSNAGMTDTARTLNKEGFIIICKELGVTNLQTVSNLFEAIAQEYFSLNFADYSYMPNSKELVSGGGSPDGIASPIKIVRKGIKFKIEISKLSALYEIKLKEENAIISSSTANNQGKKFLKTQKELGQDIRTITYVTTYGVEISEKFVELAESDEYNTTIRQMYSQYRYNTDKQCYEISFYHTEGQSRIYDAVNPVWVKVDVSLIAKYRDFLRN